MKARRLGQKKIDYTLLGFLIPFAGMLLTILLSMLVLKIMYPHRVYSMLYSDMYHQYFPFFKAYRQALLSGDSLLFSWDVGMGIDYLGLISYYLASPLYLLSVFVPEDWLLGYFTLLTPVKLGLAGLFFSIFLKNIFRKNDLSICVFGSFYALCAWALGYQWNIMWVDTFALLPLVALGTVNILKERKFVLYTVTLFFSVFVNYYIGFFTCIFVLLVCICYEICRWAGFKKLFIDMGLMVLFSALAIGMTAILELPALAALGTTHSSVNEFPEGFKMNIASENTIEALFDAMRQVAGNGNGGLTPNFKASEGLPNIYCGIGTNLFAMLYLTCKQVRVRDRICAVVLLLFFNVSFIIRQLDYMWHGFHFTNMIPYRFSFLYSFVMLYMAYRAWTIRRRIRLWQVAVALIPAIGIMVASNDFWTWIDTLQSGKLAAQWNTMLAHWGRGGDDLDALAAFLEHFVYLAYNGIFLVLYVAAVVFTLRRPKFPRAAAKAEQKVYFSGLKNRRQIGAFLILCVFCAEQVMNLVNFGVNFFPGTDVSNYPKGTVNTASMIQVMKELEDDSLFYRAEVTHTQTLNDGALNDYHGISTFTSSANVNMTNFMKALGYCAQSSWNRYIFEEGSPVSNLFLNLKYMIERDNQVESNPYFTDLHYKNTVHLLKNNAYLPLGFMTDPALAQLEFDGTGNRFTFQNQLLSAATGKTLSPWTAIDGDQLSIASRDVTLNSTSKSGYAYYAASSSGGSIFYTYTFDRAGLFCVDMNTPKGNSVTFSHEAAGSDYVTLYTESTKLPQMLAVCQVNPGDRIQVTVRCPANEKSTMTITGAVLDEAVFYEAYHILSASTLDLTVFENTRVEGTVECEQDGLLYTSIPHSGNWKVWVDGQPAEVTLIGNAMTGVMLTKGTHTVTFRYENDAFVLGCILSAACLTVFLAICWVVYRPTRRQSGKHLKS